MSEHRLEYLDLCAAWALGSLEEADRVGLEEHLAQGCPECDAALVDFSAATVLVAASAPPATASPKLRQRVLAAAEASASDAASARPAPPLRREQPGGDGRATVRDTAPPAARERVIELKQRRGWTTWVPVALAAAFAVTSGVLWMQNRNLANSLGASRDQLAQLEKRVTEDEKWASVMRAPEARFSVLEPTTEGDQRVRARAVYDPASRRAVVVFENLYKPSDKDYQLWVIKDGTPASLGVIQPDQDGRATLRLENVGDSIALSAFAVSLEPKGGSPNPSAPTGPVVMLGKLSG